MEVIETKMRNKALTKWPSMLLEVPYFSRSSRVTDMVIVKKSVVVNKIDKRVLNNTSSSHSGCDPESLKHLITLDTGPPISRGYDDIAA